MVNPESQVLMVFELFKPIPFCSFCTMLTRNTTRM